MEGFDQSIDFLGHHDENARAQVTDRGERVRRAGRDDDVVPFVEHQPVGTDQYLQLATEHAEGFVGPMVHVRRCLVARVGIQVPLLDHEVRHADESSSASGGAAAGTCRRSGRAVRDRRGIEGDVVHGGLTL
jgi:hypothetical protein